MDKIVLNMVSLILLLGYANAQVLQPPQVGDSIDNLFITLQNNTQIQQQNTKIIQDTYGKLEETMMKYTPQITFGVSIFMLIMYLTIIFFEKIRQKRNKPSYEQKIRMMEDTQKEIIEKTNKTIEDINKQLSPLVSVLNTMDKKENKVSDRMIFYKGFQIGGLFTIMVMLLLR